MPNVSGSVYGLTILSPILDGQTATTSHDLAIRAYLATLPTDEGSPFARAAGTHLSRLAVLDDVIYVGMPSCEEHLQSKYLVFESNFDGNLEAYLRGLATTVAKEIDFIWTHCVGYPGTSNIEAFIGYMKACQLETTFYFAAVNDRTVPQALTALQTQHAVADFIGNHQGLPAARLQAEFRAFASMRAGLPPIQPGIMAPHRDMKTGGRNG